jgi:hypothetical protein
MFPTLQKYFRFAHFFDLPWRAHAERQARETVFSVPPTRGIGQKKK